MVKIAEKNVLLFKSSLHLAQDGASLPLTKLINRICVEAKPKLFLSIGTAGGVRKDDDLGCALITNKARFHLLGTFKDASFNGLLFESDWSVPEKYINNANELVINVPGPVVLPISPQYPDERIEPNPSQSKIKITEEPIITTDVFLFGTTKYDLLDKGCIVEMDDAVVAMVCRDQEKPVNFGFVRNVSDPVINSKLPREVQRAWAGYIYEQFGILTSFNGALGAWAAIAGTK
jgi:nucleoside phosphorylase